MLAAMAGSFVMLGLLLLTDKTPDLLRVVEFIDEGALALLFGMMILVGKLASTGVFEVATFNLASTPSAAPPPPCRIPGAPPCRNPLLHPLLPACRIPHGNPTPFPRPKVDKMDAKYGVCHGTESMRVNGSLDLFRDP